MAEFVSFKIADNIPDVMRYLSDVERSVLPMAHAKALTYTAERVYGTELVEMRLVFDRPTRYTMGALAKKTATPKTLTAFVFMKDSGRTPASNYLMPNVRGGTRSQKRSERALSNRGLMGNKGFWVPGRGAKLDASGNISGPTWTRILSDLQVTSDAHQWRNTSKKRGRYFVPRIDSRLPLGVYEHTSGKGIKPIAIFVGSVSYKPRFDFYGLAERTSRVEFPVQWGRAFKAELTKVNNPKVRA